MLGSRCEVYENVPDEGEFVTTFADTTRVMQFQEVTVVKVLHTLTLKVHFVCPQNVM
jgi:hypothetical protein